MYLPYIRDASLEKKYVVGPYHCLLMTHCVGDGPVQYDYLLTAHDPLMAIPRFVVAAEIHSPPIDGKSHFLCSFEGNRLDNYGASNEWGCLEAFVTKAFEIIRNQLQLFDAPVEEPLSLMSEMLFDAALVVLSHPTTVRKMSMV